MNRIALLLGFFGLLQAPLAAADFEIGPQEGGSGEASEPASASPSAPVKGGIPAADVPVPIEAGEVQTAYGLKKYELRTDFKFYEGGGILSRAWLGLFPQFFIGGAANVRSFIGSGELHMNRDDAQLLARLVVWPEDDAFPGLALGWDGPQWDRGEAKGLYLSVSKEVPTALGFVQVHGGLNSSVVETFVANRDLRASLALTGGVRNLGFFTEVDEALNSRGTRWNAGLSANFAPLSVSLEWRDMASGRERTPVSRLLRVAWQGRF